MPRFYESRCAGVYYIQNRRSGKMYIGSSENIKRRVQNHVYNLSHGIHPKDDMQSDYDKGDRFEVGVLYALPIVHGSSCVNRRELREVEKRFIEKFGSAKTGYNRIREILPADAEK